MQLKAKIYKNGKMIEVDDYQFPQKKKPHHKVDKDEAEEVTDDE